MTSSHSAIIFHGGPVTWFGEDAVSAMLSNQSFENNSVLVVTDSNLNRTKHFAQFASDLSNRVDRNTRIDFVVLEPKEPSSQALSQRLEMLPDYDTATYIGYGGGSVMDSAKVFRASKDSRHTIEQLVEAPALIRARSQLILIPTTAGTGSEMSPAAIFEYKNEKIALLSYQLRADTVAIQPQLCATCPRETVESSGIDAFAHALESTISNKANFCSSILSPASVKAVYRALRRILETQALPEQHLMKLCEGIMLTSVSYGYAGCCGIHALAYPLASRFHIRHGQAVALVLLPVLRYYLSMQPHLASSLARCFNCGDYQDKHILEIVGKLLSLCHTLPRRLSDIGVSKSDLPSLAAHCQRATRLLANSPVPIAERQALHIYSECL